MSLEVSPGIGFPGAPQIRSRAADVAATSARCRWKRKAEISFLQCRVGEKKNKNRGGRDAFVSLMWSLKGRNISCSVEPIMSCDLLLQGGQFFSSPLVAKYLIVIITTGRKKFY